MLVVKMNKVNLFKLNTYNNSLPTCLTHQANMIVGLSFFILEVIFLTLYIFNFWFKANLTTLVLLSFILILVLAWSILYFLELNIFNLLFYLLLRGRPLIVFRHWLSLNHPNFPPGISFGLKHVRFNIINELKLNFWGSLEIKSNCLTGSLKNNETILTIPFNMANYENQTLLINTIKSNCPNLTTNARLDKFIVKPPLIGAKRMHGVTLLILLYLLFDINYTTFNYLELLKDYFYALKQSGINSVEKSWYYKKALQIESMNPKFSYIWSRFYDSKHIKNNIVFLKAKYLFDSGNYMQSLDAIRSGLKNDPKNFRLELINARFLSALHKYDLADKALIESSQLHETKLLPKFYRFSLALNSDDKTKADKLYNEFKDSFDKDVFGDKDKWPPFSSNFLDDIWYREDFNYIFEMLLHKGYKVD